MKTLFTQSLLVIAIVIMVSACASVAPSCAAEQHEFVDAIEEVWRRVAATGLPLDRNSVPRLIRSCAQSIEQSVYNTPVTDLMWKGPDGRCRGYFGVTELLRGQPFGDIRATCSQATRTEAIAQVHLWLNSLGVSDSRTSEVMQSVAGDVDTAFEAAVKGRRVGVYVGVNLENGQWLAGIDVRAGGLPAAGVSRSQSP